MSIFSTINCFHLKKGLSSKRRDINKVILRAVSHIALLRCRLIYNQHYIYVYVKHKSVQRVDQVKEKRICHPRNRSHITVD